MKVSTNKTKTIAVTLVLIFALSLSIFTLPTVRASDIPTYARLVAVPNPVGVDQLVMVKFWLDNAPPGGSGPTGTRYEGYEVTIEMPDGTIETEGPYTSDAAGSAVFYYTPTVAGTYKLQFHFPGQTFGANYHEPSESSVVELVVQEEQIPYNPEIPLPDGYWSRPINAENREWYSISGNWLMQCYNLVGTFAERGVYAPYTTAPDTSHIVWTKELTFGGIVGGDPGYGVEYYAGLSYEHKLSPPVIISGRLYYNIFPSVGSAVVPLRGVVCVDLRTGEEIWRKENMTQIDFGQIYNYESPNQHGAVGYLWAIDGSTWEMYDAYTGTLLVTLKNATASIGSYNAVFGPSGELLVYTLDGTNNWLSMWNSSYAITRYAAAWRWRPGAASVMDWNNGIQWNVTVPDLAGAQSLQQYSYDDNVIIAEAVLAGDPYPTFEDVAYNAETGEQLWAKNRTDLGWGIAGSAMPGLLGFGNTQPREGVYVFYQTETMQWHAISIATGNELWKTKSLETFTNSSWSIYDWPANIANGTFYAMGESGCVTAFDMETGAHLWTYSVGTSAYTPSGTWPIFGGSTVADGKMYVTTGGHFPGVPADRGNKLHCIDLATGQSVWNISGWFVGANLAIADGYMTTENAYDNRIYCFGKGQTATTVSASPKVSVDGDSVLIEGTVLDESPGAAGTAAIADEYMSEWME